MFGLIKGVETHVIKLFQTFYKRTLYHYCSKVSPDSTVYTDGFKIYDGLVDFGRQKYYRAQYGNNEFANSRNCINGIENSWGWAKMKCETTSRGITFYVCVSVSGIITLIGFFAGRKRT